MDLGALSYAHQKVGLSLTNEATKPQCASHFIIEVIVNFNINYIPYLQNLVSVFEIFGAFAH